jgi:hypothetical protein
MRAACNLLDLPVRRKVNLTKKHVILNFLIHSKKFFYS